MRINDSQTGHHNSDIPVQLQDVDRIEILHGPGSLTLFSRREQNVIDWIRESTREKWRTSNIRKLRVAGAELSLEQPLNSQLRLGARYRLIVM